MNGKFIVIEGLDGSGKTTQLTALAQNLRALGYAVAETAEPTASTTGGLARDALSGFTPRTGAEIAALFMAGVGPGLIWSLVCVIMVALYARKHPELRAQGERPTLKQAFIVFLRAVPALLMIIVVIGGILLSVMLPLLSVLSAAG